MCWSWGTEAGVSANIIYHIKESPGGRRSFFELLAWGSITFEETVLGDTVNTTPLGFFLHYIF
jgi:hypothetical protein